MCQVHCSCRFEEMTEQLKTAHEETSDTKRKAENAGEGRVKWSSEQTCTCIHVELVSSDVHCTYTVRVHVYSLSSQGWASSVNFNSYS